MHGEHSDTVQNLSEITDAKNGRISAAAAGLGVNWYLSEHAIQRRGCTFAPPSDWTPSPHNHHDFYLPGKIDTCSRSV
jgi:hypothetical protein